MGRLKDLRTLATFIVGKSTGSCIKQLRELSHLRGKLSILKLRNVLDLEDAVRANLKNKKDLKELELAWGDEDTDDSEKERHVLDKLQPSVNLEKLTISFYAGISFPNWLGNSYSLSNIQVMRLSDCSHCLSLPSFGQLPTLKVLYIERMKSVMTVGFEFYGGNGTSVIKPFQSLEKLAFKEMPEWEEWQQGSSGGQRPDFTRLQELILDNCPKLKGLRYHLPCLKKLSTSTFTIDCLKQLRINEFPGVLTLLDTKSLSLLQYLNIQTVVGVKCLPKKMVHSRTFLHHLGLYNCPSLELFPKDSLPTTLTTLIVANCKRLEFLPHEMMSQLTSLDYLRIENSCDSLNSFPLGILSNLSHLVIHTCENMESLPLKE
ncbi:putative disease resistance protein At3g14460 [Pyrus x bretschneideri]|uniref:putative disease resistance protein At3g14460 n=1 Tax=Pyrus x bretschneideri TaxID=225117 RepID=UPI002030FBE1|nr:putative disease resistance protein At3g14460 [Pyrus x bretschneideri]